MLFTRHTLHQGKVESYNAGKTISTETNNTLTIISNWSHQTLMKDTTYSDPASMKLPNSDGFFPSGSHGSSVPPSAIHIITLLCPHFSHCLFI